MLKKSILLFLTAIIFYSCNENAVKRIPTNVLKFQTPGGQTIAVYRQMYESFSMIHPLNSVYKTKKMDVNKYFIPIEIYKSFSDIIQTEMIEIPGNLSFKNFVADDLQLTTNEDKTYWTENTFYHIPEKELVLGNASDGFSLSGTSVVNQPMQVYIFRTYLLSLDSKKVLKLTGMTMAEPGSEMFDNAQDIQHYLYNLRSYFLTVRFE